MAALRNDVAPAWDPERNPPPIRATPLPAGSPPERPVVRIRYRVMTALAYVLLAGAVMFFGRYVRNVDPMVVPVVTKAAVPPAATRMPEKLGISGKFGYAPGYGPKLGKKGKLHRFQVAVELPAADGLVESFAAKIDRTLGDKNSWIASGHLRLRRVPRDAKADFVIYLASARTSERMCREGGLKTDGYTSCRLPGRVILNDDRWTGSVRGYRAPLETYRQYVINHEVGHQLGHGHEACPGRGKAAPVMMQQTYGLKGCTANPWPYVGGHRYAGKPVA